MTGSQKVALGHYGCLPLVFLRQISDEEWERKAAEQAESEPHLRQGAEHRHREGDVMADDNALRDLAEFVKDLWEGGHLNRLGKPQQEKLEDLLDAAGYGWQQDESGGRLTGD